MGHPPEDVMCIAIDGGIFTRINATVTTKQIRKVIMIVDIFIFFLK
jgi:hypothetical protein